jgi:hypothetical protein
MSGCGSRWLIRVVVLHFVVLAQARAAETLDATASSSLADFAPSGAVDGNRFSATKSGAWKGQAREKQWWWQVRFPQSRTIGAILQVQGDQATFLRNAPHDYVWQGSVDGRTWQDWQETETTREERMFRLHRFKEARQARYVRLLIRQAQGAYPTLREVEFHDRVDAKITFPDWAVVVNQVTDKVILPGSGQSFLQLAHSCKNWEKLQGQEIFLSDFDEAFVAAEPRPLCAFVTGSLPDWCQRDRRLWRGFQEVLRKRNLPMWASCGGAQALAILEEVGLDPLWDCPKCRDALHPKLPIYTHIGFSNDAKTRCGDYSNNIFERGKYRIRVLERDPVFERLPREFETMESHCGQVAYLPKGWVLIATKGREGLTKNQCFRVKDRYIYGAQFHIEMEGTPESSRRIMTNFLALARQWGGYNPRGRPVPQPSPLAEGQEAP